MKRFPKNRKKAIELNSKFFFTGDPCKNNHVCERNTKYNYCVQCNRDFVRKRYKINAVYREQCKKFAKKSYKKYGTRWHHANKVKAAALNKAWRKKHKKAFYKYCKEWRRKNLDKLSKNAGAYRATKIQATPKWANLFKIEKIYTKANKLKKTVDHIVPLSSKLVCGLHVENNLRIIPTTKNSSKGNRKWPNMW